MTELGAEDAASKEAEETLSHSSMLHNEATTASISEPHHLSTKSRLAGEAVVALPVESRSVRRAGDSLATSHPHVRIATSDGGR